MSNRANAHNHPMHAAHEIRLAIPAEAIAIARMSRDWIEHGLGWRWTADKVLRAIGDPATNVAVVARREPLHGFGIMQYLDDDAHLVLLAVSPVMRHQGLGRHLMAWLEHTAQVAGSRSIQLECRADNRNAIAFYERLGYITIGRLANYYEAQVDAVQLRKCQP